MTEVAQPMHRPPAVDKALKWPGMQALVAIHGRALVLECLRVALESWRQGHISDEAEVLHAVQRQIEQLLAPSMRAVFNLTGTVLHTNLGRAPLPPEAIEAMTARPIARTPRIMSRPLARVLPCCSRRIPVITGLKASARR